MLRERRERKGHLRRLADSSAKRKMIAAVASRAVAFVHGSVEFALKVREARMAFLRPRRSGPAVILVYASVHDSSSACIRKQRDEQHIVSLKAFVAASLHRCSCALLRNEGSAGGESRR